MRRQGRSYKLALVVIGALLLVMLLAASALANTNTQTRVQAIGEEVCPYIAAQVPNDTSVPLVGGGTFQSTFANPLAALYLTSTARGFSLQVSASQYGPFVEKLAGYGDPVTFADWWGIAVNGFMPPVGVGSIESLDGDSYLWMNVPSTAPWNNMALVVSGPSTVPLGQNVAFTVVGDDLSKVNSEADIARFGLDPATTIVETPAEFAPISAATVHAGAATQTSDAAGQITVTGAVPGTYSIWAEKAFDDDFFYVPSTKAMKFTVPFSDVTSANPFFAAIHKIAGLGIVGGYPTSPTQVDYRPENNLYRAQFAKVISIALGLDVREGSTTPFADLGPQIADNLYPHDYVAAAYAAGITNGLTATTFGPYGNVTRAQVLTMVVRALQKMHSGALAQPPADYLSTWGAFSDVHGENARIAEFNGLLDGLALTTTAADPWAPMSRGEMAQVLANMIEFLGK